MHLQARDSPIPCPPAPPCPACSANEVCQKTARTDTACATVQCVAVAPSPGPSSSSGGVSTGAIAGAAIGAILFLAVAVGIFFWYRKTYGFRPPPRPPVFDMKPDIPAPAETVLSRVNPTEKPATPINSVKRYSRTTIDLDPNSQENIQYRLSTHSNPFTDSHSIQTAGTEGTNVIPIALVSPDPNAQSAPLSRSSSTSTGPTRPVRSPELNLNLEHINVSNDNVNQQGPKYAASQISGLSGVSGVSSRNSYMSNASYSSDFLNEAPMIVTPTQGAFRQVLGVVKAEVIHAPAADSLRPSTFSTQRPSVSSPLAATSFGPSDFSRDSDEANPFSDKHTSTETNLASPSASVTTFGQPSPLHSENNSTWHVDSPTVPWMREDQSRPSSMSTQVGSVIGIESATRVNLGLSQLSSLPPDTATSPRSPYRTTMARIVSPKSAGLGVLQEQQRKALEHAHARAKEQGLDRRVSGSSVLTTLTQADSILESFPFVPPSPISNRPVRSPPVSPLGQQTFSVTPASPLPSPTIKDRSHRDDSDLPTPPSRHTLGLSTASQFSTASTGLGSFPFQIDSGSSMESSPQFLGRQRASLDTLALTNDLSSYPLGIERDSTVIH